MPEDTICAIATPLGEGGLAVIRISGSKALSVADGCFRSAAKSGVKPSAARTHTIHYGHALCRGEKVDEVMLAVMRGPGTFTREDIVEITCHGGMLPARVVLTAAMENGARLAEPGEFTKRAFLNGRIDLAQAEAVADLIHSRTELALKAANEQLEGRLSRQINLLRDEFVHALAHVEAHIDFPEEDIAPETRQQIVTRLEESAATMERLLATAHEGQILRRGIRAAIVGRPNAGKSSLLNQLLGRQRAIVSSLPGTTRDTIEETADIRGVPVVFIDTAGLREARDEIEAEGIRRSRQSLSQAELVLQVLDNSEPFAAADDDYLTELEGRKRIVVLNKLDLPPRLDWKSPPGISAVKVCCLSGEGIEALKDAIKEMVWSGRLEADNAEVTINARHQQALDKALSATRRTLETLGTDWALDVAALDLRIAVNALGEIVGKTTSEDILDAIFSKFCIGK
jgi:tRNA modification GTPase